MSNDKNNGNTSLDQRRFSRLPETNRLIARARMLAIGELISTEEVQSIIGRIGGDERSCVQSAIKVLEKEGVFLRYAPKSYGGLKRLTPSETTDRAASSVPRIHRAAAKEIWRLGNVDFESLTLDEKRTHVVTASALGAVAMLSTRKAANKIASRATQAALDIGQTLSLFHETK